MDKTDHDGEFTKDKESSALIEPSPLLKCDNSDSSSETPVLSSTPKVFLRPSTLAAQTEKLKILKTIMIESSKSNTEDVNVSAKAADSVGFNSSREISKTELTSSRISTSFSDPISLKCSQSSTTANESSFGLFSRNSKESHSDTGGFVFGQNLHERAANYEPSKDVTSCPTVSSTDLTFESLQKEDEQGKEESEKQTKLKRTLSDEAKEYESKKVKTILEEVSVVTGEEEEYNVLQINCKLFSFDKEKKNWHERGRGILRLNDKEVEGIIYSRVVMRTQGSLRVILNTKIWSGMKVEHASEKTIRLTALDASDVNVFLIMSSAKDSEQLFSALGSRISALKSQEESLNKNCSANDSSFDESASLSSAFDISSNDSFQDYSRKCFGNTQDETESAESIGNDTTSRETKDNLDGSADSSDVTVTK